MRCTSRSISNGSCPITHSASPRQILCDNGASTIAFGDIHGCSDALAALIDVIAPGLQDVLILLGDYIDRGPDSRGVLDQLIACAGRCQVVPLLGDHEEMLLDALRNIANLKRWL